jgi:hypothetical protein
MKRKPHQLDQTRWLPNKLDNKILLEALFIDFDMQR